MTRGLRLLGMRPPVTQKRSQRKGQTVCSPWRPWCPGWRERLLDSPPILLCRQREVFCLPQLSCSLLTP